jgi:hypothetical protein
MVKKLALSLVKRRLLNRPKNTPKPEEKKPRQVSEPEGARLDPETGGSANVGREVEGRRVQGQEKITRGRKSVVGGIVEESTSKVAKARAKTKVELEALVRKGKATPEQKSRLKAMESKDVADTSRAARTAAATRRANASKTAGTDKRDPRDVFIQTGEIMEGYNPTQGEISQALSNLQARQTSPKLRERMAILEKKATGAKTLGKKSGGSMKKKGYKSGGSVSKPRGVGCAMRGYGKAM